MTELEIRFWSKVRLGDGCWEWTAATKTPSKSKTGGTTLRYGVFRVSQDEGTRAAHIVSFIIEHGREPTLPLLHSCDNPKCVRPRHLIEGTLSKNLKESWERGRRVPARRRTVIKKAA